MNLKMKHKIVFLQAALRNSHFIKRVLSLRDGGFDIKVYGFERDNENANFFPKDISVEIIGYMTNGKNYLSRLSTLQQGLNKVFIENPDAIFYATTFDIGFFCWKANRPYIYEISDFVYVNFPVILHPIFRFFDRILVKKSKATVLTSEGFHQYLFKRNNIAPNILFLPNKLNKQVENIKRESLQTENEKSLNFSFIGLYRYPNTILRFARIIGEYFPYYTFHFWGNGELKNEIQALTYKYPNIIEHGPFKNPDDLPTIYAKTDLVIACYDTSTINERIAEPNKLYEALFFCKPIIVSKHTYLAEKVELLQCGYAIDPFNDEAIVTFIKQISKEKLKAISQHISRIDSKLLIDDPKQLYHAIQNYFASDTVLHKF